MMGGNFLLPVAKYLPHVLDKAIKFISYFTVLYTP